MLLIYRILIRQECSAAYHEGQFNPTKDLKEVLVQIPHLELPHEKIIIKFLLGARRWSWKKSYRAHHPCESHIGLANEFLQNGNGLDCYLSHASKIMQCSTKKINQSVLLIHWLINTRSWSTHTSRKWDSKLEDNFGNVWAVGMIHTIWNNFSLMNMVIATQLNIEKIGRQNY